MTDFFLVKYRRSRETATTQRFSDWKQAATALRSEERSADADTEVVLLFAKSEADLRRTHARYFTKATELTSALAAVRTVTPDSD